MVDLGEPCASIIKNQSNDLAIFKFKKKKLVKFMPCVIFTLAHGANFHQTIQKMKHLISNHV
jgi:hypothetical protein